MYMDKLSVDFSLKQHTPIIHFQHDQPGATLRATEVKPKLDRYIWERYWENDFERGKFFLVGYSPSKDKELQKRFKEEQYCALDYKMAFQAHEVSLTKIPEKMPLYFGNMGSDGVEKKDKHFVFAKAGVSGSVRCMNIEFLDIVQQCLPDFFLSQNFGTRQNKGFGSFQVTQPHDKPIKAKNPSKYFFSVRGSDLQNLWIHIDLFYRTLRSGINLKGGGGVDKLYFKSLLFHYALTQKQQWDKRKIRLDLFRNHPRFVDRDRVDGEKGIPMLYRDMLGLSSTQSWLSYNKATVNKTSQSGAIDRFKSPITFKPIRDGNDWKVYIIPHKIPAEMKSAPFVIESGSQKTVLATPEFDLEQYLKFAFSFFQEQSVEDYVGEHLATREVKILENIYHQLTNQSQ